MSLYTDNSHRDTSLLWRVKQFLIFSWEKIKPVDTYNNNNNFCNLDYNTDTIIIMDTYMYM